jgi:3',5'-cyclic-AMP phosphodiesterase
VPSPIKLPNRPAALTRRGLFLSSASLAVTTVLPGTAAGEEPLAARKRVLRIGHLTDIHVQPEKGAGEGFAAALRHLQHQPDPPDWVLFGGDNLMNVDGAEGADRAQVQLDVWNTVLRNELGLPYTICIGNHDVLRMDPRDGKQWAVDTFQLPGRYYHIDRAGWRLVVLDSTYPEGDSYKGRLDEQQFDWLAGILRDTPATTPVFVLSHIPILAACAYFDGENEKTGDWVVPGSWMHVDARRIKDLFLQYPNVKACLSGHIHLVDQVQYNGLTYCCNGAVSGAWWDGPNQECQTGYALVDLYDDGTVHNQYVTYPWAPRKE